MRDIDTEDVEAELLAITGGEPEFNTSPAVATAGFHVADKDFDILRTASSTSIEAWDLQRGNTVYAVKFGTAQNLGYVCDQALAVLEILRNQANIREIPDFEALLPVAGLPSRRRDSVAEHLALRIDHPQTEDRELGTQMPRTRHHPGDQNQPLDTDRPTNRRLPRPGSCEFGRGATLESTPACDLRRYVWAWFDVRKCARSHHGPNPRSCATSTSRPCELHCMLQQQYHCCPMNYTHPECVDGNQRSP